METAHTGIAPGVGRSFLGFFAYPTCISESE
jgi:hypothetical protein